MSLMTIVAVVATAANPGASTNSLGTNAIAQAAMAHQSAGLVSGPYAMSAALIASQARDPLFPDALDMNGIDSVKELLGIVAAMNDDARTALLQATLHALNQRIANSSGKTKRWLEKKKKIVQGAMDTLGIPY